MKRNMSETLRDLLIDVKAKQRAGERLTPIEKRFLRIMEEKMELLRELNRRRMALSRARSKAYREAQEKLKAQTQTATPI